MIDKIVLDNYGVDIIDFEKGEYIFKKGNYAENYFQILSGGVKMNFYNESGNEFIQGIFGKNKSFGEPPLLIDSKYPANAICLSSSKIYKLNKMAFKDLLLNNSKIHFAFTKVISERLYYKATIANGITSNSAEKAIISLLNYLKYEIHEKPKPYTLKVDFTRKNIAGLLGLSVESTIRTIKKMEAKKILIIRDKKIYY